MFDYQKPTIQMLARAPWEKEDTEIFEEAWKQTGQILIQVRDTNNSSYDYSEVRHQIILALRNYKMGVDYEIMKRQILLVMLMTIVSVNHNRIGQTDEKG